MFGLIGGDSETPETSEVVFLTVAPAHYSKTMLKQLIYD